MGKNKVLVKVHPEGKYVVDLDKSIEIWPRCSPDLPPLLVAYTVSRMPLPGNAVSLHCSACTGIPMAMLQANRRNCWQRWSCSHIPQQSAGGMHACGSHTHRAHVQGAPLTVRMRADAAGDDGRARGAAQ